MELIMYYSSANSPCTLIRKQLYPKTTYAISNDLYDFRINIFIHYSIKFIYTIIPFMRRKVSIVAFNEDFRRVQILTNGMYFCCEQLISLHNSFKTFCKAIMPILCCTYMDQCLNSYWKWLRYVIRPRNRR